MSFQIFQILGYDALMLIRFMGGLLVNLMVCYNIILLAGVLPKTGDGMGHLSSSDL